MSNIPESSIIRFSNTTLPQTGKKGILKPDSDGYYTQIVGAFGTRNYSGTPYSARGVKDLFDKSSSLMRRVRGEPATGAVGGSLRGENGHPIREHWMTDADYSSRLSVIHEPMICVHWAEFYLDFDFLRNSKANQGGVAVFGRFRPSGAQGHFLAAQLENPLESVCFSIRSTFQLVIEAGIPKRMVDYVCTFDKVNEGGILAANKYYSPGLENLFEQKDVTVSVPSHVMLEALAQESLHGVAIEDSAVMRHELAKIIRAKNRPHVMEAWNRR